MKMRNVCKFYLLLFSILLVLTLFCSKEKSKVEKVTVGKNKENIKMESVLLPDIDSKYDKELLNLSRKTLRNLTGNTGHIELSANNPYKQLTYGVFVTLKENGELRGCIGQIFPTTTVENGIEEMTMAAALNDPRFKPVTSNEINKIKIEISILYNMHEIRSIDDFVLKRDGIVIKYKDSIGVLLPQVAEEEAMTKERFFEIASMKAGLGPEGWKTLPVELYSFNCKIIKEED